MIYKSFFLYLLLRILFLLLGLTAIAYGINHDNNVLFYSGIIFSIIMFFNIYRFSAKRFVEMDDFFEAVKYRDFSRWFSEEHGPADIRELHKGFNRVNKTFKTINNERQAQFLYLQKILSMVDVGIIAYECLAGIRPFAADTPFAVLMKHVSEQPRRLTEMPLPQHVPESVEKLIFKML